jgi:hypothetical protein
LRITLLLLFLVASQGACASTQREVSSPPSVGALERSPVPGTTTVEGLTLGDEVRATVGTFPPFVGTVQAIQDNTLSVRTDRGEAPLRLSSIRVLEVRRYRRTRGVEGGVVGAVLGAVLGRVTLIGLSGEHWESQGRILAPGLGAIAGGLIGALLGSKMLGDYWEVIPVPDSTTPERGKGVIPRDGRPASRLPCLPVGASRR